MNIFDEHLPPRPTSSAPSEEERSTRRSRHRRDIESVSKGDLQRGSLRLSGLASRAFETLEEILEFADYNSALQAAKIILDRSGFGPSSTIKIDDTPDLSNLSSEELAAFAMRMGQSLQNRSTESPVVDSASNVSLSSSPKIVH